MIMWKTYCKYTVGNCKAFLMLKQIIPQELTAIGLTKEIRFALQMRRNRNNVFVQQTGIFKGNSVLFLNLNTIP